MTPAGDQSMQFKKSFKHWTSLCVLSAHLMVLPLQGQPPLQIQGGDLKIPTSFPVEITGGDFPFTAGEAIYANGWKAELLTKLPMSQIDPAAFAKTSITEFNAFRANPYHILGLHLLKEIRTKHPEVPFTEAVKFTKGVAETMQKRSNEGFIKSGEDAMRELSTVVKIGFKINKIGADEILDMAKITFNQGRKPYDDLVQSGFENGYNGLVDPGLQRLFGMNDPASAFYAPGSTYSLMKEASDNPDSELAWAVDLYLQDINKVRHTTRGQPSELLRANPEAALHFNVDRLSQDIKQGFREMKEAQTLSANEFIKTLQSYKKAVETNTEAVQTHSELLKLQNEQMKTDLRLREIEKDHMVYRQIISAAQAIAPESKEVAVASAAAGAAMQIQVLLAAGLSAGATTAGIGAVVVLFVAAMVAIFSSGESADQVILREIGNLRNLLLSIEAKIDHRFREAAKHMDENFKRLVQRLDSLERFIRGDLKDISDRIRQSHADLEKLQDRTLMIGAVLHRSLRDSDARPIQAQIDSCLDTSPLGLRTFTETKYFECLSTFLTCATHHASDSVSLQEWMGPQAVGHTGIVDLQEEFARQFTGSLDWNQFRAFNEAMERTVSLHRANSPVAATEQAVQPSKDRIANPLLWATCVDAYLTTSKKRPELYRQFDPGQKKLQRLIAVAEPTQRAIAAHRNPELFRYLLNDYTEATRDFTKALLANLRTHRDNPKIDLYAAKDGLDQKALLALHGKPILTKLSPCAWDLGFQKFRSHNGTLEGLRPIEISGTKISDEAAKPFSDAMWDQVPEIFRIKAALGQGSIEWCYSDYGMDVLPTTTWDRNFEHFTGHPTFTLRARFLPADQNQAVVVSEFKLKSDEAIAWALHCWVVTDEGNRARFGYEHLRTRGVQGLFSDAKQKEEATKKYEAELAAAKVEYDKAANPASHAPYFRLAYGNDYKNAHHETMARWENGSLKEKLIQGKQIATMAEPLEKLRKAYEDIFKNDLQNKRIEVFTATLKEASTKGSELRNKLLRISGVRLQLIQAVMFTLPEAASNNQALRQSLTYLPDASAIVGGMERSRLREDQKGMVAKEFDLSNPEFIRFGEVTVREALLERLEKLDTLLSFELRKPKFASHPLLSETLEHLQLRTTAMAMQAKAETTKSEEAELEPKLWNIDDTQTLEKARAEFRKSALEE